MKCQLDSRQGSASATSHEGVWRSVARISPRKMTGFELQKNDLLDASVLCTAETALTECWESENVDYYRIESTKA